MEATRVTVRDLARNTAEVLERVATGEKIEITRNGIPVAVISPPDPAKAMLEGLIKAGIIEPDWQERQRQVLERLRKTRRSLRQDERPLSEVLTEMREEETR